MFSKWLSNSPRKQLNRLRSQSWSFSKKIWKLIADILVISGLTFHQKAHSMHGKPQNSPRLIIRSIFVNSNHRSAQPLLHIECDNFFTPPDTKSFYHMLLKLCLRNDSHNDSNLILSKDSSELLNKVGNAWRITPITRSLLLLNVSSDLYQRRDFSQCRKCLRRYSS